MPLVIRGDRKIRGTAVVDDDRVGGEADAAQVMEEAQPSLSTRGERFHPFCFAALRKTQVSLSVSFSGINKNFPC